MSDAELKSLLSTGAVGTPSGRIVRVLSQRGPMSAREIAQTTGLAKSTVSTALTELRRSGMVVEGAGETGRSAGAGRPAATLSLNPQAGTCVGLLFGMYHVQMIVADVSHAVIADETVYLEPDYSPEAAAALSSQLIERAYAQHGISPDTLLGIGLAVAGPINPIDGRVQRAGGVPTWAGVNLKSIFEHALERPIFVDNESNCSAIAEMMWGAAVGYEDFVFFTLDLGIGGAIVNRGHVITGIAGAAGEFGHMSINPEGPLCRCGNRGCLELYASFKEPLVHASKRFGRQMTMDDVIQLAKGGDVGCRRLIEDMAEAAGRGLGIIGAVINPGLVVIGGRMATAGDLLLVPLEQSYNKHTLIKRGDVCDDARTRIVVGKFVDNDACLGAVGMVLRHYGARA
jgi:predicted NBD/HSP70 family sugar kinase/biotin operon repressor